MRRGGISRGEDDEEFEENEEGEEYDLKKKYFIS